MDQRAPGLRRARLLAQPVEITLAFTQQLKVLIGLPRVDGVECNRERRRILEYPRMRDDGEKLVHARPRYRPKCTCAAQPMEQRLGGWAEGTGRAVRRKEQRRGDGHQARPPR